jgi:hypothetical protein
MHSGNSEAVVQRRRRGLLRRVMAGDTHNLLRPLCEALAQPLPKQSGKNKLIFRHLKLSYGHQERSYQTCNQVPSLKADKLDSGIELASKTSA